MQVFEARDLRHVGGWEGQGSLRAEEAVFSCAVVLSSQPCNLLCVNSLKIDSSRRWCSSSSALESIMNRRSGARLIIADMTETIAPMITKICVENLAHRPRTGRGSGTAWVGLYRCDLCQRCVPKLRVEVERL